MSRPKWRSIGELQAAQSAYHHSWWLNDPAAQEQCDLRPGLREKLETMGFVASVDVFKLEDGSWCSSRMTVHEHLVGFQIGKGPRPEHPTAYFTIGAMASGKSSRLRPVVHLHRKYRDGAGPSSLSRVDADEVRESLPEYHDGRGSLVVQQECFDVTYDLVYPAARDAKMDIVFDTIGRIIHPDIISFAESLRDLKANGYEIQVLLADAPLEVCVERAQRRALEEKGRLIEVELQKSMHGQPEACLHRLRAETGLLDGWVIFDTYSSERVPPIVDGSTEWLEWQQQVETERGQ